MLSKIKILIILIVILPTQLSAQDNNELFLSTHASIYNNNYNDAIISLSKLIDNNNNADYLVLRSKIYLLQNNYEKASQDCINANKLKHNIAHYQLAKIFMKQNNYLAAINYLNKYLVSSNHLSLVNLLLDSNFTKIHYTEDWESLLQQKWSKQYISSIKNIIDFLDLKNYNSALKITNELIFTKKNNAEIFALRTYILTKENKYTQALEDINKALEIRFNKNYLIKRARIYSKLGKSKLAISDYNKLIYITPENFELYKYRANEYIKTNEIEKAQKDVDFILEYLQNNQEINFINAQLSYKNKNYISTLRILNKLINMNKANAKFYILRADTYMQTQMYNYASKDYSMDLDINPRNADTYYKLAISQIKNNNKQKACSNLKKAIRYGNKKAILLRKKYCSDF